MIALDFRGAFDKVWWRGFLKHLWAVGVRSTAYKLFESYLSERSLIVVANEKRSEEKEIGSGVPQGAIWSPLLFNIFVREVPLRVRNALSIFNADDLTLVRTMEDGNRIKIKQELEEDLQRLVEFGNEWLLQFEPKKTQGLTISKKHDRKNIPEIKMDGITIKEEKAIKVFASQFTRRVLGRRKSMVLCQMLAQELKIWQE